MTHDLLAKALPELSALERILERVQGKARVETVATIDHGKLRLPIYSVVMGTDDRTVPTLGMFGGVHGLERIGTQVVLSFLQTLSELLSWDESIGEMLTKTRIVFMPLINPVGMYMQRRSNGNGVDLMRNAPVEGEDIRRFHLHSGHRFSARLPWFQGHHGAQMETEAKAVCDFVRREMLQAKLAVAVDVHSGYGAIDRLWFPYAKTKKPFPHLPEMLALRRLLDRTYPNHVYRVEPQSKEYSTHGDLWDYLYDEQRAGEMKDNLFLPLTLEMGSWIWIRKNYRQMFSLLGAFNPLSLHRQQRTLRRHLLLFEFLQRAVMSGPSWAFPNEDERARLTREALDTWYGR